MMPSGEPACRRTHTFLAVPHSPEHVLWSLEAKQLTPSPHRQPWALSAGGGRLLSPDGFTGILHSALSGSWLGVVLALGGQRINYHTICGRATLETWGGCLNSRGMMAGIALTVHE